MTNYPDLPSGDKAPQIITTAIEIPNSGINKYVVDHQLHVLRLGLNRYSSRAL